MAPACKGSAPPRAREGTRMDDSDSNQNPHQDRVTYENEGPCMQPLVIRSLYRLQRSRLSIGPRRERSRQALLSSFVDCSCRGSCFDRPYVMLRAVRAMSGFGLHAGLVGKIRREESSAIPAQNRAICSLTSFLEIRQTEVLRSQGSNMDRSDLTTLASWKPQIRMISMKVNDRGCVPSPKLLEVLSSRKQS